MEKINIKAFASSLTYGSDEISKESNEFLNKVASDQIEFVEDGGDYTVYFVKTGGSEAPFKEEFLKNRPDKFPIILLPKGDRNSLASCLEISSYLSLIYPDKVGVAKILLGSENLIRDALLSYKGVPLEELPSSDCLQTSSSKVAILAKVSCLGVIGGSSSWLIGSEADYGKVKNSLGIDLVDIDIHELYDLVKEHDLNDDACKPFLVGLKEENKETMLQSLYIYTALKGLVNKYGLEGFTLKCFDLLTASHQTSCLAFAMLNAEGITSGCEGDIPSMLTMYLIKQALDKPSFMCNPSHIDLDKGEIVLAHCTVPLTMCYSYHLTTHFESGKGIGVKGDMPNGEVSLVKLSPDLEKIRIIKGEITQNLCSSHLCRTQVVVKTSKEDLQELLSYPFGNHLLLVYGEVRTGIENYLKKINSPILDS